MTRAAHVFVLLGLFATSRAQVPDLGSDKVTVTTARFVPHPARAGETVRLEVALGIEAGWHIYGRDEATGTPTELVIAKKGNLELLGTANIPKGEKHDSGGIESWWIAGQATLTQQVVVPAGLKPGKVEVTGTVKYMACTEQVCDPPGEVEFKAILEIVEGEARAELKPKKVQVEARFKEAARPGEAAVLDLDVTVAEGWHIYGAKDPTANVSKITVTEKDGLQVGKAQVPDGVETELPGLDDKSWHIAGKATFRQTFVVPKNLAPGQVKVGGKIEYLPCTEAICDEWSDTPFEAVLAVEKGEARADRMPGAALKPPDPPAPKQGESARDAVAAEVLHSGLFEFLLLAIGWGLFALVMPCTYPMIPITISFFTKQANERGGKVLPLSLTYGAGIVLIFVLIGIVVGEPITRFAAHAVTNLVIGVLFLVFALSLFGMFTLQPPQFLMNMAGKASTKGGYGGVFLMGVTLVVTSFTCTAPFVGNLLAVGAQGGGLQRVVLGMAVFGLTMAIPFVFLSLLPGKIQALPRSGEWMNTLKVVLGFVEVAAALKFLSNTDLQWEWKFLSRELFLYLWTGTFVVAGLFLLGMFRFKGESGEIGPGRLVAALSCILFASYCGYGAAGNRMDSIMTAIIPPYSNRIGGNGGGNGASTAAAESHPIVVDDYDAARAAAAKAGKRLLVNFTGVT